jgi:PEP-CTERM motif
MSLASPSGVRADGAGYTYTYTGNDFTTFVGGLSCPTDCSIDGSFTVATALTPDTTTDVSPNAFDFYISTAGAPSWTNSNGAVVIEDTFFVTTNAADDIISWDILIGFDSGTAGSISLCGPALAQNATIFSCGVVPLGSAGDAWTLPVTERYATNNNPGSWSPATYSAPEPSTLALLAFGLLAVARHIKRNAKQSRQSKVA